MLGSPQARADLALLLVTLISACGWIFSREALQELPPLLFIGFRFLLAGTLLWLVAPRGWRQIHAAGLLPHCLGLGVLFAGFVMCWILGLRYGQHLGVGAFIFNLGAVLVPVMAWLLLRERAPRSTWLSLPVAGLGLALLSSGSGFSLAPGQGWFLASALLFSLHVTLVGHVARALSAVPLASLQLLVVGVVGVFASALAESWPASVSTSTIGWFLASALLATSLRFVVQMYGQSLAPPSHAALIIILEPVWTALLAALWYGERMSELQITGCTLIFGALLVSRWSWVAEVRMTEVFASRIPWILRNTSVTRLNSGPDEVQTQCSRRHKP